MAGQLDGETVRIRAARGQGLVPPSFLLDRTIEGITRTIAGAAADDGPDADADTTPTGPHVKTRFAAHESDAEIAEAVRESQRSSRATGFEARFSCARISETISSGCQAVVTTVSRIFPSRPRSAVSSV